MTMTLVLGYRKVQTSLDGNQGDDRVGGVAIEGQCRCQAQAKTMDMVAADSVEMLKTGMPQKKRGT